ncbi:MAG: tRNA (adenosine(37)-N6)-threonylcarbamoyltransferase complex transferase subunit TsaD [Thermodesulfovibrionales bacterium]
MFILGIDTSCDDSAAAVIVDGKRVLSSIVSSQETVHKRYGGIVPELASRRHIEMIWPVTEEALRVAGIGLDDLSGIAVCHGPGLIGSLLVGCSFAKALCYSRNIPLIPVNHIEGHIFSSFLKEDGSVLDIEFPFLSLIVSGGHTSLYRVDGFGLYKELGRTRDDAAGEAYDKVSKLLGLGYPGGPVIDSLAREGNPDAIPYPRAYLPGSLDFSFSGLKTAVRLEIQRTEVRRQRIEDIAASFQAAVIDVIIKKVELALKIEGLKTLAVSGGVGANSTLRKELIGIAQEKGLRLFMPPLAYCTDNAAMIALAGYYNYQRGIVAGLDLNPVAYLTLGAGS